MSDNKTFTMVDLKGQYLRYRTEIDTAMQTVIEETAFVKGKVIADFETQLAQYLGVKHVITCGNGTDALQIAFMALGLKPGDEVIVPSFTYVATAEVLALLGLIPVMVDVSWEDFNLAVNEIEQAITPKTRAIVPVHLFGQSAGMEALMAIANEYSLWVVEDNAQAIGAQYTFSTGKVSQTGTIGHIGTTSFFPSKNLGAFGDGGAMMTNNDALAEKMRMIANHGQRTVYYHDVIGVNSRLDSIQAAVLGVKLRYLGAFIEARQRVAAIYDTIFESLQAFVILPSRSTNSTHVFHQYTLKILGGAEVRNGLKQYLADHGIPSVVYYPLPLYRQEAYKGYVSELTNLPKSERLCASVLSLPIHTELHDNEVLYIGEKVRDFFEGN